MPILYRLIFELPSVYFVLNLFIRPCPNPFTSRNAGTPSPLPRTEYRNAQKRSLVRELVTDYRRRYGTLMGKRKVQWTFCWFSCAGWYLSTRLSLSVFLYTSLPGCLCECALEFHNSIFLACACLWVCLFDSILFCFILFSSYLCLFTQQIFFFRKKR